MKMNRLTNSGLLLVISGGLIAATVYAIDAQHDRGMSGVSVAVDKTAVDRTGSMPASFSSVISKVTPSVAKVEVTSRSKLAGDLDEMPEFRQFGPFGFELRRFFGHRGYSLPAPREHGAASGVVVTPDGYLLTNHHVVKNAEEVEVTLHDGRRLSAKVVGEDPKSDLAVIKVDASDLPAITFADSSQVEVGDVVLAVGNPFGLGQSVTMGMVSATGRASLGLDYEDFIQTDAAINPGNSGGALTDSKGRLVGINTAIVSRGGGNDGIGFAIPSNMARTIMNDLISTGRVNRPTLGVMIQDLSPELAPHFGVKNGTRGALVGDVMPDSPAEEAGLRNGDVIIRFGDSRIDDARGLKLAVADHKPGEKIDIKLLRNGKPKMITAKLDEQADEVRSATLSSSHRDNDEGVLIGVGVADLDAASRRKAEIPGNVEGALVTQVDPSSEAWESGLRPGDVIEQIDRKPVRDAEDAVRMTTDPGDRKTLLRVWSRGASRFVSVDESRDDG